MRTISIKQLHEATGRCVREACAGPLIVTERGERVAVLRPYTPEDRPATPFPRRSAARLPRVAVDSTELISADRSDR